MKIEDISSDELAELEAPKHAGAFAFSPDFPRITHIDDVRPQIRPDTGINAHVWGGDYIGVNYAVSMPETFLAPIDLECRGAIFERESGDLVSRAPLHKFFNAGERQLIHDLPIDEDHWFEKKLDGSLIGAFVDRKGEIVFHTRGGFSRQARAAGAGASAAHRSFIRDIYDAGFTPGFEWTGPQNRVILKYEAEALTLLSLRERTSGLYMPRHELEALAARHGVPVAPVHAGRIDSLDALKALVGDVRALTGEEGVVMVFANGHRVKIKAEAYQIQHKIVSDLASEKNAQRAWAENAIDDIVGILADERGAQLAEFGAAMDRLMLVHVEAILDLLDATAELDGKARAARIMAELPKPLQGAAFAMAKGQDGMDQMRRIVSWGFGTLDKMAEVRKVFDLPKWSLEVGDLDG